MKNEYFEMQAKKYIESVLINNTYESTLCLGRMQGCIANLEIFENIEMSDYICRIIDIAYRLKDELLNKGIY
uniref:Uncharacterized protein n=1 Tax=Podoviridae sp. ct2nF21 TaxID=2826537 RepID=A0A8S5NFF3_9CAUD|nr:MAG TPA: hypothetical protein [Podoviridae sp. ct2nF21]